MSVELVALGGAVDPEGIKPPIGGSAYALIVGDSALLIDCGVYPRPAKIREHESEKVLSLKDQKTKVKFRELGGGLRLPVLPKSSLLKDSDFPASMSNKSLPSVEILKGMKNLYVVATHAHADHSAALPWLKRMFPNAEVMMTEPTLAINLWSWRDHIKISAREKKSRPLYDKLDVSRLRESVKIVGSNECLNVGPFDLQFFPAGHILGAVSVKVTTRTLYPITVFFSGDISFKDQYTVAGAPLLDTGILGQVHCLVSEATYAGNVPKPRKETEERLAADIEACLKNGGKFLAGSLTIGRAQELFSIMKRYGITERWKLHIDGSACRVSRMYTEFSQNPHLSDIAQYFVSGMDERNRIFRSEKPCVVIAPAGMYTGGWSVRYASAWAEDPRNVIALTSYQDPCSAGEKLARIVPGQVVKLGGEKVTFNAQVKSYPLSAHMDGDELLGMIERLNPRQTFLVHGEEKGIDSVRTDVGSSVVKTLVNTPYNLL